MQNLRGFKAVTKPATDHAPERIKITDLRFNKTIVISYGAKTASTQKDRVIEHLKSLGIQVTAQTWAENEQNKHLYSIYLSPNFNIELNNINTQFLKEWKPFDKLNKKVQKAIYSYFTTHTHKMLKEHGKPLQDFRPLNFQDVDNFLGLAYTSTSSYAGLWCCDGGYLMANETHHFTGFAINTDNKVIATAENETEHTIYLEI